MIEDYNNTNGDYCGYSRSWINLSLKESQPLLPCKPNVCATFQCNRFLIALPVCFVVCSCCWIYQSDGWIQIPWHIYYIPRVVVVVVVVVLLQPYKYGGQGDTKWSINNNKTQSR